MGDDLTMSFLDLKKLGWNAWFEGAVLLQGRESIARVAAVHRDQLLLIDGTGAFRAKLAGNFRFRTHGPEDVPCVGDWVCVERGQDDDFAMIHAVLERRSVLRRKAIGGASGSQMIAANVDTVFIVQSCYFDFNLNRLERYLVMVTEGGAEPVVLLTKTDLVAPDVLAAQLSQLCAAGITAPVITLSNVTREGIDELKGRLAPGKTYCFVGSSGVGKSTIVNELIGQATLEVQNVSATGEGKHTTVRRELILLPGGALVVDTPGMREFGVIGTETGIVGGFVDINSLAESCRYRDCTHTKEPGCAVLHALDAGEVDRAHYENYLKLREEAEFSRMSDLEKRRKDRDFGRYIKSVKKDLKR